MFSFKYFITKSVGLNIITINYLNTTYKTYYHNIKYVE